MTDLVGYIPFLHPINPLQGFWYLLVLPLSFGISVIYKAMRMPSLEGFWRQVTIMTSQIILYMIALAIALVILLQVIIPRLPAE